MLAVHLGSLLPAFRAPADSAHVSLRRGTRRRGCLKVCHLSLLRCSETPRGRHLQGAQQGLHKQARNHYHLLSAITCLPPTEAARRTPHSLWASCPLLPRRANPNPWRRRGATSAACSQRPCSGRLDSLVARRAFDQVQSRAGGTQPERRGREERPQPVGSSGRPSTPRVPCRPATCHAHHRTGVRCAS